MYHRYLFFSKVSASFFCESASFKFQRSAQQSARKKPFLFGWVGLASHSPPPSCTVAAQTTSQNVPPMLHSPPCDCCLWVVNDKVEIMCKY